MKKFILILLIFSFGQVFSNTEKNAEQELKNERINIFQWGTAEDVRDLITKLISEEDSDYVENVIELLDSPFADSIIEVVFKYLQEFKSPQAFDNAIEILKYFDEYSENTVKLAISYISSISEQVKIDDEFVDILWMIIEVEQINPMILILDLIKKLEINELNDKLYDLYLKNQTDIILKPHILSVLAHFSHPQALGEIIKIIEDKDGDKSLRWEACRSAANYKNNVDVEKILANTLNDADPYVRMYAYESLFVITDNNQKYYNNSFRDSFWKIREIAIISAGKQKLSNYVPVLKYLAENDKEQTIKRSAINSLGQIANKEALDFLKETLYSTRKSTEIRIAAVEALDISKANNFYKDLNKIFEEKLQENQKNALLSKIADLCRSHDYSVDLEIFYMKCMESTNFVLKVSALRWMLHTKVVFSKDTVKTWSEKEKNNLVGRLSLEVLNLSDK